MVHEKQYKQTFGKYIILIFSTSSFFCVFYVYFELTKKIRSFSLNLKKKDKREKLVICFDPLHVVDVAAVFPKQKKRSDTNVLLYYKYIFNIIILIAYVALVNKRISQFIGWHVCQ